MSVSIDGYADKFQAKAIGASPDYMRSRKVGTITYYDDLTQGSEEWHALRCGILTASEMKLIITPTMKQASNDKERAHLYELLAQRITGYVEPRYVSDDMLRGKDDEIEARSLYAKHYSPVRDVGFITNDKWGFAIGYSPDGLVGEHGAIECKSRNQKYQMRTLLENVPEETIDPDFAIQVHTGMMVAELEWVDLVSYCGGLPMAVVRVHKQEKIQAAILDCAAAFESRINEASNKYHSLFKTDARLISTQRRVIQEIF